MTIKQETINRIKAYNPRHQKDIARKLYALEMIECVPENAKEITNKMLLNGANDWQHYSESGNALVYDYDIAERCCCYSLFKKKKEGDLPPGKIGNNYYETWIDYQVQFLQKAARYIRNTFSDVKYDWFSKDFICLAVKKSGENEFRFLCNKKRDVGYTQKWNALGKFESQTTIKPYDEASAEFDRIVEEYKFAHNLKLK